MSYSMYVLDLKGGGKVSLGCGRHHYTAWRGQRLACFEVGFPPRSWHKVLKPYRPPGVPDGTAYQNVPLRLVAACIKRSGGFTNVQAAEGLPLLDVHIAECLAQDWMFFSHRAEGV
jgi:hypothetical protein